VCRVVDKAGSRHGVIQVVAILAPPLQIQQLLLRHTPATAMHQGQWPLEMPEVMGMRGVMDRTVARRAAMEAPQPACHRAARLPEVMMQAPTQGPTAAVQAGAGAPMAAQQVPLAVRSAQHRARHGTAALLEQVACPPGQWHAAARSLQQLAGISLTSLMTSSPSCLEDAGSAAAPS
jgi:hypothetical protein